MQYRSFLREAEYSDKEANQLVSLWDAWIALIHLLAENKSQEKQVQNNILRLNKTNREV